MDLFSTRLKTLRKERDRTQEEMAKLLNIRRSTYGEYERGKIVPPMDKMKVLADYFGVSVDYLFGNTNFETHKERNEANPMDISKQMKIMLEYLQDNQAALTYDGELLDKESRELLLSSLENSIRMANIMKGRKKQ